MKLALLALLSLSTFGAVPVVSNVQVSHVGHSSALISFSVTGTPNGDGTYWNYLQICYSDTSGHCAAGTGKIQYTSYPNSASVGLRQSHPFNAILSGVPATYAGKQIEVCPEASNDNSTYSTPVCALFTLNSLPVQHPQIANLPHVGAKPHPPTSYSGFHSGASTGSSSPGAITATCDDMLSDIQSAVINQTSYGTVISMLPGQAHKCTGRYFPYIGNPPDVHTFGNGDVNVSTHRITWTGSTLSEGQGVQFAQKYSNLPGWFTDVNTCTGIKMAQVYYVHAPTANDFQLTCNAPFSQGGVVMKFPDSGGGPNMYVAKYPRMVADGGVLYPIVIRTSTPDSQLPPIGTRMNAAYAEKLFVIQPDTVSNGPLAFYSHAPFNQNMRVFAFSTGDITDDGNFYLNAGMWFDGVQIQTVDNSADVSSDPEPTWNLVQFRRGTSDNGISRAYIHGRNGPGLTNRLAAGIEFEGHNNAIVDSYFDQLVYPFINAGDISYQTEGTQFIQTAGGPGPLWFVNNYFSVTGNAWHLNGASFGGGTNGFNSDHVSDIVFQRNYATQEQKYCMGAPGSTGYEYRNRQPFEQKGGFRSLLDGNIFDTDCHFIASTMSAWTSVTDGLEDVTVTNNTYRHVSSVGQMGSSTQGGFPFALNTTSRYYWHNNLIWDVNGLKYEDRLSSFGTCVGGSGGTNQTCVDNGGVWAWNGWTIHAFEDGEDQIFDHNTVVTANGAHAAMFWSGPNGPEGFKVTNNFLVALADTNDTGNGARVDGEVNSNNPCKTLTAYAMLTCDSMYPNPVIDHNVITTDSASFSDVSGWWPGQMVPATPSNLSLVGWTQFSGNSDTAPNFRLSPTSPYIHAASDGAAVGADIDALERAQGKVIFNGIVPASTTATVYFVAPSSQSCPVDVAASQAGFVAGSFTRFSDSGTAPGPRSVSITGLTGISDYWAKINCEVEQPVRFFHTN